MCFQSAYHDPIFSARAKEELSSGWPILIYFIDSHLCDQEFGKLLNDLNFVKHCTGANLTDIVLYGGLEADGAPIGERVGDIFGRAAAIEFAFFEIAEFALIVV